MKVLFTPVSPTAVEVAILRGSGEGFTPFLVGFIKSDDKNVFFKPIRRGGDKGCLSADTLRRIVYFMETLAVQKGIECQQ